MSSILYLPHANIFVIGPAEIKNRGVVTGVAAFSLFSP
jgi:hypothetical protein